MTGAYLRVQRDEKWENIEVEHLTDAEIEEKFLQRTPAELVNWIKMLCGHLRYLAPLMAELERDGIVKPVSKEEYEKTQETEQKCR